MRTITTETKVYSFSELSEQGQQKAIENNCYINTEYEWWDFTYSDAKEIGLKIDGFDLDRNKHATGEILVSANDSANKIITIHGKESNTYSIASEFLSEWAKRVEYYSDGITKDQVTEDNERDFDNDADDLESYFLNNLLKEYANILQNEYDHRTSSKAIKETLIDNNYEFTEEGNIFNY